MTEYKTILIDPPWPERGGGKIKRGADRHYKVQSVADIMRIIWTCEAFKPAADAHLYMWATNTYLIQAGANVIPHIGFRYITCITWPKPDYGIGQYFRGQTEHALFAVKGKGFNVKTERKDLSGLLPVWKHPQNKHSAKPPSLHELIEARSNGPYLEMFAREKRSGWDAWGNEV